MIVNGRELINTRPLHPMAHMKLKDHGVSYGLSEAGYDLRIKQSITLHPFRRFALASTIERFTMPSGLVCIVHDKSSNIRRGLIVGNSVVEPGWEGWLTLELFYHGWKPLRIPAGMGIAQAIFHQIAEPTRYRGKYQNQADAPVASILEV